MDIVYRLKCWALFGKYDDSMLKKVAAHSHAGEAQAGEWLFSVGDNADNLYLLESGELEVLVDSPSSGVPLVVSRIQAGEYVGESALIEERRIAGLRARTPVRFIAVNTKSLQWLMNEEPRYLSIYKELMGVAFERLSRGNRLFIEKLEMALLTEKKRLLAARVFVLVIIAMSMYIFVSDLFSKLLGAGQRAELTLLSVLIMCAFVFGTFLICRHSGFELRVFGFTRYGLSRVRFSLPLSTGLLMGLGWMLWFGPDLAPLKAAVNHARWSWQIVFYLVSVLFQEVIYRSAFQAPMQLFLSGRHSTLLSILTPNLIFLVMHLHMGLPFALSATVCGLVWGWLFYRSGTLLAPIISHAIIGLAALLLLDLSGLAVSV